MGNFRAVFDQKHASSAAEGIAESGNHVDNELIAESEIGYYA